MRLGTLIIPSVARYMNLISISHKQPLTRQSRIKYCRRYGACAVEPRRLRTHRNGPFCCSFSSRSIDYASQMNNKTNSFRYVLATATSTTQAPKPAT